MLYIYSPALSAMVKVTMTNSHILVSMFMTVEWLMVSLVCPAVYRKQCVDANIYLATGVCSRPTLPGTWVVNGSEQKGSIQIHAYENRL